MTVGAKIRNGIEYGANLLCNGINRRDDQNVRIQKAVVKSLAFLAVLTTLIAGAVHWGHIGFNAHNPDDFASLIPFFFCVMGAALATFVYAVNAGQACLENHMAQIAARRAAEAREGTAASSVEMTVATRA